MTNGAKSHKLPTRICPTPVVSYRLEWIRAKDEFDVEKNRKEGFDFVLNADGSFNLSTKTQNSVYVYNTEANKYVLKSAPSSKSTSKKRR